jgi:RNA polymerase primary sigma factor
LKHEPIFPNFVLNKKRNRRDLSTRAKSFIALSGENYSFLNDFPKLDYFECKELSQIMNGEEIEGARKYSLTPAEAKDLFISSNLKLVRNIASDYSASFNMVDPEDLFQMGIIGLIRAVEKWDPEREFLFSTYATWWIKQSISREYMNTCDSIRIPVHLMEIRKKVLDYIEKYDDFFGRKPDSLEACDALEIEESQYINVLNSVFEYISLGDVLNSEGELEQRVALTQESDNSNLDPAELFLETLFGWSLAFLLAGIPSREAGVISERYGLDSGQPATLDQIGLLHGVTRERIRQIEAIALKKLRDPSRSDHLRYLLEVDNCAIGHQTYLSRKIDSEIEPSDLG